MRIATALQDITRTLQTLADQQARMASVLIDVAVMKPPEVRVEGASIEIPARPDSFTVQVMDEAGEATTMKITAE